MDLQTIRSLVYSHLKETDPPVGVTEAEVNRYVNDGYRDLAEKTLFAVEEIDLTVNAYENFIELPSNSLAPLTFTDKATGRPIDLVHWEWIDKRDRFWVRKGRSRPSVVAAFGLSELVIWPHYLTQSQITMNHSIVPDELVNDTDEPEFPEQHHMALVYYATYCALRKDADGEQLGRSMKQHKRYLFSRDGLEVWTLDRHANIRMAIYGNVLRTPGGI